MAKLRKGEEHFKRKKEKYTYVNKWFFVNKK